MSNNSTSKPMNTMGGCDKWYSQTGAQLELPVYYVIYPTCHFIGFIGRIFCLIGFYKQSKTEPAYFYQVSLTIGEMLELLACTGYNLIMICGWNLDKNPPWCLSNYSYMWYEAHLADPLMAMALMIKNLQAIFMAADRLFALWKPILYRSSQHHKSLRAGSVIVAVFFGISTSIFDCFRYSDPQMRRAGSTYSVSANNAFLQTTTATALSGFRDALRFGILIVLVALNVVMVRLYLKQRREIDAMLGQTAEERKQRKAAKGDNTLLLLTLTQCFFNTISIVSVVMYYSALAAKPSFDACEASFWGPVSDGIISVCEVAEFALIMTFSRYFRRIILEAFQCCKSTSTPRSNVIVVKQQGQ